jgi:hypothetical protein
MAVTWAFHSASSQQSSRSATQTVNHSSSLAARRSIIGPSNYLSTELQLAKWQPFFPYLQTVRSGDRATEFKQRCKGLGVKGVSLNSYRY